MILTIIMVLLILGLKNCSNNSQQFKDTHKEKAASNKTPALAKSMNMDNWVVGT